MPRFSVNNIELDYDVTGHGEALLLLHGLGSTKKDWENQVPYFSKEFKVVTVDLRGHGETTCPSSDYGVDLMVSDVKGLLDYLEIDKVIPVGFSMGGAVAFQLAYDYPDLINKLVIVNSGPDFNDMGTTGEQMLRTRTKMLKEQGLNPLAEQIAFNMFPEPGQEALRKEFEQRCKENDLNAYYHSFVTLMQWGMGERIKDIKAKTLVITSDMDYTPVAFKSNYVKNMNDATLEIIKNSRHGVVMDQPDQFNKVLYKFLKGE